MVPFTPYYSDQELHREERYHFYAYGSAMHLLSYNEKETVRT